MKLNAEFLSKNRYWLVLSIFAFLWLTIALMVMAGCVTSAKEKVKTDYKKAETDGNPDNLKVKSKGDIANVKTQTDKAAGKKGIVHIEAWEPQKNLLIWPAAMQDKMKGARFGEPSRPGRCKK